MFKNNHQNEVLALVLIFGIWSFSYFSLAIEFCYEDLATLVGTMEMQL